MFWSKNKKKIGIPLHTQGLLYKSGVQGVYITRTCVRDESPRLIYTLSRQGVDLGGALLDIKKVQVGNGQEKAQ